MMDAIFSSFLEEQEAEALALARKSDLLDVIPVGSRPFQHFLLRFYCKGLVQTDGGIAVAELFEIGVFIPLQYHERANPAEVLTLLGPVNLFHPNARFPFICAGQISPGMQLTDLILQCFEILTWNKVTMREDDALNAAACSWARQNLDRFPVDDRPLLNRSKRLEIRKTATRKDVTPKEARR